MIDLHYTTTSRIPPLAEITPRTSRNDRRDIAGRFEDGAWQFSLAPEQFGGTFDFSLVLDRAQPMDEQRLTVTAVDGEVYI